MYSDWVWLPGVVIFSTAAIIIWLGFLSFFIWQQNKFVKNLFPKSGERDIRKKFEEILGEVGSFRKGLDDLKGRLSNFDQESLKHIQRVKLLRFNPYQETGGDQSFTVALLDEKGNGFVLTSLHARSGTRIFGKPIKEGRGVKYQLSSEEEIVVRKAME